MTMYCMCLNICNWVVFLQIVRLNTNFPSEIKINIYSFYVLNINMRQI